MAFHSVTCWNESCDASACSWVMTHDFIDQFLCLERHCANEICDHTVLKRIVWRKCLLLPVLEIPLQSSAGFFFESFYKEVLSFYSVVFPSHHWRGFGRRGTWGSGSCTEWIRWLKLKRTHSHAHASTRMNARTHTRTQVLLKWNTFRKQMHASGDKSFEDIRTHLIKLAFSYPGILLRWQMLIESSRVSTQITEGPFFRERADCGVCGQRRRSVLKPSVKGLSSGSWWRWTLWCTFGLFRVRLSRCSLLQSW